ncbi:ATP-binding protein, partial [Streptomyces sp. NPDC001226]
MRIPANELAASAARKFVRAVLAERIALQFPGAQTANDRLVDDAVLLADELVAGAVMHTGYEVEVACRVEAGHCSLADFSKGDSGRVGLVVEVLERDPSAPLDDAASGSPGDGKGLQGHVRGYGRQLMRSLAESWGVTYRCSGKATWFRLECALASPLATMGEKDIESLTEAVRNEPSAFEPLS